MQTTLLPETKATHQFKPFVRACYPLMNLCKRFHRQRVHYGELSEFAGWAEGLGQQRFRAETETFLQELGYQTIHSDKNSTDLLASRDEQKILVRVINDATDLFNRKDGPDTTVVSELKAAADEACATAGLLVSVNRLTQEAKQYTADNRLFCLCYYDLYKCLYANRDSFSDAFIAQLCGSKSQAAFH